MDHDVDLEDLRLAVYGGFAATGRVPDLASLAAQAGADEAAVAAGLRELGQARHVVLDDRGQVIMAHPFAAGPMGFSVMGPRTLWWGGCAWDSFALPHLLPGEGEVLVATRCPGCGQALAWNVGSGQPPAGPEVAHFLVPAARWWDDVVHACRNQRLFCSGECVAAWLAATGNERGYVLSLDTLWNLAAHWYDGRMDRGYARRDRAQVAAYLRGVGLTGPFWEL